MNNVSVYPIGTYVKFTNGNEQNMNDENLPVGMVVEINIRQSDVLYLVVWWNGKSRSSEWVTDLEIVPVSNSVEKTQIGYCR